MTPTRHRDLVQLFGEDSGRWRRSWLLALAIHLGLFLGLGTIPLSQRVVSSSSRPVAPGIEVGLLETVDSLPQATKPQVLRPSPGSVPSGLGRRSNASREARRGMDDGAPATGDGLLVQPDSESGDAKQGGIGQSPGSKQPRRSLEALGIGSHNPFFADPLARMPVVKPTPTERFQQSMRSSVAQADQRRGLGPEGPLLARLERETINSSTPADSSAKFRAATNERGELVSLTLLEATSESRLWEEVARRTLGALGGQRLVANSSTARVRMDLRVISRVQLASGKDPGLGVDVLRLPVKRRPKKNSSRLSFLRIDPKVLDQEVRMPSGDYVKVPMLSLGSLFELGVDPVDIVPKARRVVRTHLERIEALP